MIIKIINTNFLITLHAAILFSFEERRTYKDYKIYHVYPKTQGNLKILAALAKDNKVEFLNTTTVENIPVEMLVKPEAHDFISTYLTNVQINFVVSVKDVSSILPKIILSELLGNVTFQRIMTFEEITDYVNRLFREYRTTVHLYCFTRSPKGHCIHFIRISADLKVQKPILLIEAGMHAREWIAPAQALYIIHQLVENPENDYLIKNNEWHIIPVFNPDGYEYSHETDVFWRKTRNTLLEPDCMGVDPNRNFPFKWYADYSNLAECSSSYGGPHSLSISETARFKDYVTRVKKRIRLYLSFHSHGNHILYPWGYTNVPIETKEKLHEIASDVKETIEAFGKYKYTIGSFNIINNGFGLSTDWAMNDAKIDLVYTIVLPRCGLTGFHPKGDEILPILNQMFEGVKIFANYT